MDFGGKSGFYPLEPDNLAVVGFWTEVFVWGRGVGFGVWDWSLGVMMGMAGSRDKVVWEGKWY